MQKGFSFIEFLVYFCIFSIIIPLFLQQVVKTSLALRQKQNMLEHKVAWLTALDIISTALSASPALCVEWKCLEPTAIVWHDAGTQQDKGICCIQNRIWYSTGVYQQEKNLWHKHHKEVIAESCTLEFALVINKATSQEQISYITCTIQGILNNTEGTLWKCQRSITPFLRTVSCT